MSCQLSTLRAAVEVRTLLLKEEGVTWKAHHRVHCSTGIALWFCFAFSWRIPELNIFQPFG
jgi:hypothetical protein